MIIEKAKESFTIQAATKKKVSGKTMKKRESTFTLTRTAVSAEESIQEESSSTERRHLTLS